LIDLSSPDFDLTPTNPLRPSFGYVSENVEITPVITIVTSFDDTDTNIYGTARSVMEQSLQQWEWLIVNNGTKDQSSLAILEELRKQDARVRVIDLARSRSRSAALNIGFSQAKTEYVLVLNIGDLLEPTALEKLRWFLESHREFAFAAAKSITFGAQQSLSEGFFSEGQARAERNQTWPDVMFRREMIRITGGYDEAVPQELADWEFLLHCTSLGYWGGDVMEYLHWHFIHPPQISGRKSDKESPLTHSISEIRDRYEDLWEGKFPRISSYIDLDLTRIAIDPPFRNRLRKTGNRLLILLPWMELGGAERFVLNFMRQITENGWQVSVVATAPAANAWQYEFERISPDIFPLHSFISWSDIPRFIDYFIRSRNFDALLISGSIEGYRLLPYIRSQFPQLAILDYLHSIIPHWMDGGTPRLSTIYEDCLDLDIASCHQVKRWMIEQGTSADRIRVCMTNVDADFWHPDGQVRMAERENLCLGEDQILILYIARLEPEKQPQVFAKVMLELQEKSLPFRGLVIGDGTLRSWMEQFIKEQNLQGSILMFGEQPSHRVHDLMSTSDILFLPSKGEGISQVIFEAMSCGLAIVSADIGGQAELVTPQCGLLLSPVDNEADEVSAYTAMLQQLILDTERRRKMGEAGRERIQDSFRLEHMGQCMDTYIQESMHLRQMNPRTLQSDRLAELSARETIEYLQALHQVKQLWRDIGQLAEKNRQTYDDYLRAIQPLSAREYLYLSFRSVVMPIYKRFQSRESGNWMLRIKDKIKRWIVP
jgi:glycosyltransferase involved in cell wall biosynthesis